MIVLLLLFVVATVAVWGLATWSDEQETAAQEERLRVQAEAMLAEQRVHQLTADALHAMLDVSRQAGVGRRGPER